jgi:sarcosine oxidase gamma subunit
MAEGAHPLAALAAASPRCEAVALTALPPVCRLLIRGDAASIDQVLPDACRATAHDGHALLWLGPDEFLLLAANETMPRVTVRPPVSSTYRTARQR